MPTQNHPSATYRARYDDTYGPTGRWLIERRTPEGVTAHARVPAERLAAWLSTAGLSREARRRVIPAGASTVDLTHVVVRAARHGVSLDDLHALPFEA